MPRLSSTNRRDFLRTSIAGGAILAIPPSLYRATFAADVPPSEKVRIGFIGVGGQGVANMKGLMKLPTASVVAVCDVDTKHLKAASGDVEKTTGKVPVSFSDHRKLLESKDIDAVLIATPDHWHTPAAILAMEAGKHVYVEKPCSHNIREGRLLVEAAARTGKLLQVGTQSRSAPFLQEAMAKLHAGEIGEILAAKSWNSQLRRSIGKTKPTAPPSTLDYALWQGPAPETPYRANMLPGIWRWWYDFGCGDIGNDGVHDIDVALWGLNATTHPTRVACLGGKLFFDDDQQFPDTQYAVFEYAAHGKNPARQFIFEQRIWSPYVQEGYENGTAYYGTKGMMIVGHSDGWKLYGPKNKLIAEKTGSPELTPHHTNFFECTRGTQKQLNAPATAGHLAAAIVHLANIAARVGKTLTFDPATEQITNDAAANALVKRQYRAGHWAVPKGV